MRKIIPCITALLLSTSAMAQDNYTDDISDLPVYNQMMVVKDLSTVFDTPEGRVVQVTIEGDAEEKNEALNFYTSTLPQLGWVKVKDVDVIDRDATLAVYERGEEELTINLDEKKEQVRFEFSIRPK